jgi:pentatricopeptide repeat protein
MLASIMKRMLHQSAPNKSKAEVYKGPTTKKVYDGQQFKSSDREKTEYSIMKEVQKRKNVKLYNHYLSEAAKRKSLAFAKNLFSQLQEQGLTPNEFTYTCLINACSRCFNVEEAESYLRRMQKEQMKPNEITWTAIIKGATAVFDLPKAQSLLNEMISSGVTPNTRTFNTILRACFRTGDFQMANNISSQMSKMASKPDTTTLLALTQIQAQSMLIIQATDTMNRLETLIEQKQAQNTDSQYFIDPSLYLLLASVSLLSGLALKRTKQFMAKYDQAVAKLEQKAEKNEKSETDDVQPAIAPEMVMEGTYIRSFIDKDEGFPKNMTAVTKLGPRQSPFVKSHIPFVSPPPAESLWNEPTEGERKPRKLEICSGSGDWMVARAKMDDANWAGIEIRFDRVHEMWRKVLLNRLEDRITVIHADAAHIQEIIPAGTVDEIFINFPDPPHTRWSAQRMVTSGLLRSLALILIPGGSLTVATDDFDYIRWIKEDAAALPSYYDHSRALFTRELNDYGTSYFDGLWSSRGRTDRAKLTLFSLTSEQKLQASQTPDISNNLENTHVSSVASHRYLDAE